ncbi:MAG: type III-B CRISPR-associated protein Cas10/Cmr2 [Scytonema sp. PMC 1069.18]|nr:type III-B CRISPR-associated protein Cas10/Cmr2 [Scytonema sp. PMC 1069.18]MEC4881079.1 type III-B CRISPR-associated protein Cas10/Cmr2 [Scytonema sp. PMC 1070.18]
MDVNQRKLYALLRESTISTESKICQHLPFLAIDDLNQWWQKQGCKAGAVSSSSDRVNLNPKKNNATQPEIRHPLSGQSREISLPNTQYQQSEQIAQQIQAAFARIRIPDKAEDDPENLVRLFWWCWRFYPNLLASLGINLLTPAHSILPDCPQSSYNSTVSALVGAMFPKDWQLQDSVQHPYLLIFTFSPVQEFIKSSRKFLDFWAGSYLLHYLSAILCWRIAELYGPDAVITPSLWSQEIIDALIVKNYSEFQEEFRKYEGTDPATKFINKHSQSLSTAGFPNVITAVVPSKEYAVSLGKDLEKTLKNHWYEISCEVRNHVKDTVRNLVKDDASLNQVWEEIASEFTSFENLNPYKAELQQLRHGGCWEWNKLWESQIKHSWETYFVAVPLGSPDTDLEVTTTPRNLEWENAQNRIADTKMKLPTEAERQAYKTLNVGTWWGSYQARLGHAIQSIKNTRVWEIPVASGERSTLSGQYSALHPRFLYQNFQNGLGLPLESMRLFWRVMPIAYPGVFNGSEKLNAIELTKRLAWKHGNIAKNLGIKLDEFDNDYEGLIRFPNLCSIAAAHFASHHPRQIQNFWSDLRTQVYQQLRLKHDVFCSRTRRPFQVRRADAALETLENYGNGYNGVMFSSKWLADDMGLNPSETAVLRTAVDGVQKEHFGDGSPADWWVLVLADGDGMGQYVTGSKLKNYTDYIVSELVDRSHIEDEAWGELLRTKKRMGPATHVGLNRALLDFSNRLVPYITEQRFCGRVIYSGGDDVMAALPLADLPGFLRSLRAAWCGAVDPENQFNSQGGYWQWQDQSTRPKEFPNRPLFTMGRGATMSLGIAIAHKSVPLPTVLENIWEAEKERAKKLLGRKSPKGRMIIPVKDGLCFRVIYGSGNTLEALMKGHLLPRWWNFLQAYKQIDFSPLLYRLAEELPRHADVTEDSRLFRKVAKVVIASRDEQLPKSVESALLRWFDAWEQWAWSAKQQADKEQALGATPEDMAKLLRLSAFLVSRRRQEMGWER